MASAQQQQQEYTFYFKIAYTNRTMLKSFPITLSIAAFIEQVKSIAIREFNLPETQQMEVVEAESSYMGRPAEEAPALAPSVHSLEHMYRDRLRIIAFYLRLQEVEEERPVSPNIVEDVVVDVVSWDRALELATSDRESTSSDTWGGESSGWEPSA